MGRRLTLAEFKERASIIHDGKYDYSQVNYVNGTIKVDIICPYHGVFSQRPYMHLQGQGCPECAKQTRKETCKERYGLACPIVSQESREKSKQAVRLKYGVDNVFQLESVKEKIKQTKAKNCVVSKIIRSSNLSKDECIAIANKQRQETCLRKYGVPYAIQSPIVRQKILKTMNDKYGVDNPMQSLEIRKKAYATNERRYGTPYLSQNSEIKQKANITLQQHYGVTVPLKNKSLLEKSRQTCMLRYGVSNPMQNEDVLRKNQQTCLLRYGVDNVRKAECVKNKIIETNLKRYGVEYAIQNRDVYQKMINSKKLNHTIGISLLEDECYQCLIDVFGTSDIKRQYVSDVYPFCCDFYIISRDMYIELNAFWTHGGHWFDSSSIKDDAILQSWLDLSKESVFYKNAIVNWTKRDVLKRQTAAKYQLNYVVFWDNDLEDVKTWILHNCPDRQDWK